MINNKFNYVSFEEIHLTYEISPASEFHTNLILANTKLVVPTNNEKANNSS